MQCRHVFFLSALAVLITIPDPTVAQQPERLEIDEWVVPWERSRPRDPYVGPDGKVWFVGQRSHYAAYLDPETGEFKKFDLDDGTGPHNLIVDDVGTVWYAGNRVRHIGRLNPETGEIKKFWMPDERARDPHTLVFDHDGDVWFTVQQGNFVGKFTKSTGDVQLVAAPEVQGGRSNSTRPYGIKMDSQNRPWIALFNTNQIATVDPETMEMKTYELPEGSRPRRLAIDSEDIIWYVDYRRGYLGRLDPETGRLESGPIPAAKTPDRTAWPSTTTTGFGSSRPACNPTGSWDSMLAPTDTSATPRWEAAAARSATCTSTKRPTRSGSARTPTPSVAPSSRRVDAG